MRITFLPMVAMFVAITLHISLCFLFLFHFNMGIIGIALSNTIQNFVLMIITVIFSYCSPKVSKVLIPYDMEAFCGWGEYLAISIPAAAMICAEQFAFEFITLLAGMLGVVELATMTIV